MTRYVILMMVAMGMFTTIPAFAVNRVLSLDGDGDYVEIEASESLNAIKSGVTMEAWIKVAKFKGNWMPIVYKGDQRTEDRSNRSYFLQLHRSGSIFLDSTSSDQRNVALSSPFNSIALNTWYHVAGIIDGNSGVMKILLNGNEIASKGFRKGIRVSSLPLWIGWTHEGHQLFSPFAGQIDEVRIWNITRTPEDIQTTMHTTLSGKEPGLVGYWRFDDGQKVVIDSSPQHSDGVLMGNAHVVEAELPKLGEVLIPTVIWGIITDESGKPIGNASVRLEQGGDEITQAQTDTSGNYRIVIFQPPRGLYDLSATGGEKGDWQFDIQLQAGESRELNFTLKEAISISGRLFMLDDKTPHVAVPVQAICNGKVIDGTLSDEGGKYRFINLKPGRYQIRYYTLNGYYGSNTSSVIEGKVVQVEPGKILTNLDFRFAPFKKGTWRNYTYLGEFRDTCKK